MSKHIHFLGIAGTFMGSLAMLATELGYKVSGQDLNLYPPMSSQLLAQGIVITNGYEIKDLPKEADLIIIGNVMTRGMPIIEYILNQRLPFISSPEFLSRYILKNKHVLVVSGTHGKTTTTSMLAWILQYAGLEPGFLIGGVPKNFGISAKLNNNSKYFVLEGDEYDSAFFDKRSKFVHYKPNTLIINNIEFDHADIFRDLTAILDQFHHLVRIVSSDGMIVYNYKDKNINKLLAKGCWSRKKSFDKNKIKLSLLGEHNQLNAQAAIAAASDIGITLETSILALEKFTGVARRLEVLAVNRGIVLYDDFAHHPTAIKATIDALNNKNNKTSSKIIAVLELASNTMRAGDHQETLLEALAAADQVYLYHNKPIAWPVDQIWSAMCKVGGVFTDASKLASSILGNIKSGDQILLMSNGAFGGIRQMLSEKL